MDTEIKIEIFPFQNATDEVSLNFSISINLSMYLFKGQNNIHTLLGQKNININTKLRIPGSLKL